MQVSLSQVLEKILNTEQKKKATDVLGLDSDKFKAHLPALHQQKSVS